jgi:hypothetical protein
VTKGERGLCPDKAMETPNQSTIERMVMRLEL